MIIEKEKQVLFYVILPNKTKLLKALKLRKLANLFHFPTSIKYNKQKFANLFYFSYYLKYNKYKRISNGLW